MTYKTCLAFQVEGSEVFDAVVQDMDVDSDTSSAKKLLTQQALLAGVLTATPIGGDTLLAQWEAMVQKIEVEQVCSVSAFAVRFVRSWHRCTAHRGPQLRGARAVTRLYVGLVATGSSEEQLHRGARAVELVQLQSVD